MAETFVGLTEKNIVTREGIASLNRMLKFLFDNIAGDGTTRKIYSGFGTPESVISADIGSLYMRFNGGAGTTLYIKESGTSNTGWRAV